MDWRKLEKEDKPLLDSFFRARNYENSHFNFTTFFMWREANERIWAVEDDVLYLAGHWQGKANVAPPVCAPEKMEGALQKQLQWFRDEGAPVFVYGIEDALIEPYRRLEGAPLELTASVDDMDYVYNTADLINLSGRRYHTKKNHYNAFWRSYPEAEYLPITEDIVPECKLNLNTWAKLQQEELPDDPLVEWERKGTMEVLNDFAFYGLKGGALRIGKRIVAFTFGELTNDNTVVIHVEKAAPEVRGAFTAINRDFLAHEWADVPFVNRQEDMGLDGLRRAKESYRPCRMVKKWLAKELI